MVEERWTFDRSWGKPGGEYRKRQVVEGGALHSQAMRRIAGPLRQLARLVDKQGVRKLEGLCDVGKACLISEIQLVCGDLWADREDTETLWRPCAVRAKTVHFSTDESNGLV